MNDLLRRGASLVVFTTVLLYGSVAWAQTPRVVVQHAEREPVIEQIKVNGSVVSLRHAAVSPGVAGRVTTLEADVGDRVDADAVLMRLDSEIATSELRAARAEAREAEAALEDARRRLDEARNLGPSRGISQSEIRSLEAEVRMDEQALERLQATTASRRAELDRHAIKAPFAGVVSQRMADPGEWVSPGSGVVELVDTDNLRLDFRVSQRYFPRLKPEMTVTVRFDALPDKQFPARVRAIVPVSDPRARTVLLRAELQDPEVALTPGMAAGATLALDTGRESVTVPRDALIRHPDGRITVWQLAQEDGESRVTERRVETGLTFGDRVEIREGLEPDAAVVTRGNESLRPDQEVRVSDGNGGS